MAHAMVDGPGDWREFHPSYGDLVACGTSLTHSCRAMPYGVALRLLGNRAIRFRFSGLRRLRADLNVQSIGPRGEAFIRRILDVGSRQMADVRLEVAWYDGQNDRLTIGGVREVVKRLRE